ncbi:MAG: exodeoxyribonuclease VII large subunit [Clostridiales bacterium]|nr:exodeoxyribonuclease VII large subunit [Clostridiales bacterium]
MALKAISVTQLNRYISRILKADPILANLSVEGEISGLNKHASGHWYFSLKDESSRINCFLPRDRVEFLRYDISDGMQVTAYGNVSVYERGGSYSLNIRDLEASGEGALKLAFENLKKKLEAEGLFDENRKKPLPEFPRLIGVVTSPTGAAVQDIISTVKRRYSLADIIIYPCLVQGPDAARSICEAIEGINELFPSADLIIAGRGGGSAEDLWSFNEESVARAIYASKIPVISAVGHEVDVVISDFVADARAATPTAAAELAVPQLAAIVNTLELYAPRRLFPLLESGLNLAAMKLRGLKNDVDITLEDRIKNLSHRLQMLRTDIEMHNPMSALERGCAMARSADGALISRVSQIDVGERISVIFADGSIKCLVEDKEVADESRN